MPFTATTFRDEELLAWVAAQVAPNFCVPASAIDIASASADASFRRYFRLLFPNGETRILMDAPPDKEDSHPFVQVAGLFAEAGIPAPVVEQADLEHGFLLLSDLGRVDYLAALGSDPERAGALMRPALDLLIRWQISTRPGVLPPYDEALLRRELALFPEWCMGRHFGRPPEEKEAAALEAIFAALVHSALAQPRVFVHRDFMPRNLMLLEKGETITPAVLDFQDAVEGPITYDVVSLFRDAFISWDEEQELDWVVRYWEKARAATLPVHADFGDFWRAYEWMGLQRHLKVLGIFCRLYYRDGKSRYLADLPRFIGYVRKTASRYGELKPLLTIFDRLEEKETTVQYSF
ncbi:MAG: phosphotransferase [Zoogloeaceae bacterium]|jgi:aminoglycoside/choline kinase family phosphotransferase|nr:phosphotransferase [Zoogloeaceae bacterium]